MASNCRSQGWRPRFEFPFDVILWRELADEIQKIKVEVAELCGELRGMRGISHDVSLVGVDSGTVIFRRSSRPLIQAGPFQLMMAAMDRANAIAAEKAELDAQVGRTRW